jgi:outer membrane protein assembly factor BamB
LWKKPLTTRLSQNAITPVVYNGTVIISGLDNPVSALRIAKRNGQWTAETLWENAAVPLYMANPVVINDLLFGMTHKNSGQLFLLDPRTGRTVWTGEPRFATNAAIVRAGDLAFVLKESGELLVGRPGAAGFEVLKQYQVANSSTWAVPVIAGNRIFVKDEDGLTLWVL